MGVTKSSLQSSFPHCQFGWIVSLEEPPSGPGLPLLSEDDVLDPRLVGGDLRVDPGHVPPPASDAEAHDTHLTWLRKLHH